MSAGTEYAEGLAAVLARIKDGELRLKAAGAALRAIDEIAGLRSPALVAARKLPTGWRVIEGQRPAGDAA